MAQLMWSPEQESWKWGVGNGEWGVEKEEEDIKDAHYYGPTMGPGKEDNIHQHHVILSASWMQNTGLLLFDSNSAVL